MAEEKKTPKSEPKSQADRKSRTADDQRRLKPRKDEPRVLFTDFAAI